MVHIINVKRNEIVGCAVLMTHDFISRHNLYPWVACLYVDKSSPGNQCEHQLFDHAVQRAGNNTGFLQGIFYHEPGRILREIRMDTHGRWC
ncbi:MAG: hypothetical protein PWP06_1430 [Candidatus Marinimicrobia bacterium]|nr:hypothetical protein [Candidatus Neomarinimicrobiota bacterium]